jgi:hypothetical protein
VKPVGERRHQVSVLVRRSRKPVKQDELGSAEPTRLAKGDRQSVYQQGTVPHRAVERSGLLNGGFLCDGD